MRKFYINVWNSSDHIWWCCVMLLSRCLSSFANWNIWASLACGFTALQRSNATTHIYIYFFICIMSLGQVSDSISSSCGPKQNRIKGREISNRITRSVDQLPTAICNPHRMTVHKYPMSWRHSAALTWFLVADNTFPICFGMQAPASTSMKPINIYCFPAQSRSCKVTTPNRCLRASTHFVSILLSVRNVELS